MKNQEYLAVNDVLKSLSHILSIINPYIEGHQNRVTELAIAIATELALPDDIVESIRISSTLHDIGKISIPKEILNKPGKLNEAEIKMIKMHSENGYNILKQFNFQLPVADIVLQHNEKYDGSGYPHGLIGDEILLQARILCVANVVEAITTYKLYRPGLGIDAALNEIKQNSGKLYDPTVVNACIKLFKEKNYIIQ